MGAVPLVNPRLPLMYVGAYNSSQLFEVNLQSFTVQRKCLLPRGYGARAMALDIQRGRLLIAARWLTPVSQLLFASEGKSMAVPGIIIAVDIISMQVLDSIDANAGKAGEFDGDP